MVPSETNSKSEPFKPTQKDQNILAHICKNFSCKICNGILIQCVTLSCGHQYCNYCLDMLMSGKSSGGSSTPSQQCQCPQCSSPIKYAQASDDVDQKIDNLIRSCSKPIHKSYTVALNSRFQKSLERSKKKNAERLQSHQKSLSSHNNANEELSKLINSANSFDEICQALLQPSSVNDNEDPQKKNGEGQQKRGSKKSQSPSPGRLTLSQRLTPRTRSTSRGRSYPRTKEVDMEKVNSLFGIYDHLLQQKDPRGNGNEPRKDLAGGDFAREGEEEDQQQLQLQSPRSQEPLEGMKNFTKKSDLELEALIKEADDIVKLDDHIQQWGHKMKTALTKEAVEAADFSLDLEAEASDAGGDPHNVKDDLWKSSRDLLKKLKGLQDKRLEVISSFHDLPTMPPVPRSAKLDVDGISDDSEVEEYEEALQDLEESLVPPQPTPPSPMQQQVQVPSKSRNNSAIAPAPGPSSGPESSASMMVDDTGLSYIKENIQFITEMRKYKEALMKIHNKEVDTAQEIKDLIPGLTPRQDPSKITGRNHNNNSNNKLQQIRSRISHFLPMRAPSPAPVQVSLPAPAQTSKQQQQSQRPFSNPLRSLCNGGRPMSASNNNASASSQQQQQLILPNQIIVGPQKLYMKRGRGNTRPMYTAR